MLHKHEASSLRITEPAPFNQENIMPPQIWSASQIPKVPTSPCCADPVVKYPMNPKSHWISKDWYQGTDFPVIVRFILGFNLEFSSVAVLFEGENDGQQVKRAELKRSTAFNSI